MCDRWHQGFCNEFKYTKGTIVEAIDEQTVFARWYEVFQTTLDALSSLWEALLSEPLLWEETTENALIIPVRSRRRMHVSLFDEISAAASDLYHPKLNMNYFHTAIDKWGRSFVLNILFRNKWLQDPRTANRFYILQNCVNLCSRSYRVSAGKRWPKRAMSILLKWITMLHRQQADRAVTPSRTWQDKVANCAVEVPWLQRRDSLEETLPGSQH